MKEQDFIPVKILKIYHQEYGSKHTYIEIHDVTRSGDGFRENAGRPLTVEAWEKLLMLSQESLGRTKAFKKKLIDPSILCYSHEQPGRYICWYDIAKQHHLKISDNGKTREFKVWMPAVLYYVSNDRLQIFAMKSNRRPGMETALFEMPLPNMIADNKFCWGNIDTQKAIKDLSVDEEIFEWNKMVWHTMFDQSYMNNIYRDLQKSGKRYPKGKLKDTNLRLKDLLS